MKIKDAFVPPKPNEFVRAARMGLSTVVGVGRKPSVNMRSGRSRFKFGGTFCCTQRRKTNDENAKHLYKGINHIKMSLTSRSTKALPKQVLFRFSIANPQNTDSLDWP